MQMASTYGCDYSDHLGCVRIYDWTLLAAPIRNFEAHIALTDNEFGAVELVQLSEGECLFLAYKCSFLTFGFDAELQS